MKSPLVMTEMGIALPANDRGTPKNFHQLRGPDPKNRKYRRIMGQRAHRLAVEIRTGIKLPDTAVVHHCDPTDKRSNRGPFVVCEDGVYHQIIEARTRAWNACGNANWKKCRKCLRWDNPANMQSKEYQGKFAPQMKWWHYRFKGQCVDADHPQKHTRAHTPRKRRHVAPWREDAEQLKQERAEAFRRLLAQDAPILLGSSADACGCGSRLGKRFDGRYFCVGCGAQKRAGFVGRSTQRNRRDVAMWVYVKSEPGLWTVGFYAPDGKWNTDSDHTSQEAAAERCAWLNGSRTSVAA